MTGSWLTVRGFGRARWVIVGLSASVSCIVGCPWCPCYVLVSRLHTTFDKLHTSVLWSATADGASPDLQGTCITQRRDCCIVCRMPCWRLEIDRTAQDMNP